MEDSGLEDELLHLGFAIEIKRRQLEYLCRQHRILFQPWPKSKQKEENAEIKNVSDVKSVPKLTPEEQMGLEMVHRVLSKAEKARTSHKVTEVKRGKLETSEELLKQVDHSKCLVTENVMAGDSLVSTRKDENVTDSLTKQQVNTAAADTNINCAQDTTTFLKSQNAQTDIKSNKILQNSNTSNKRSFQPNAFPLNSGKNNKISMEPEKRQIAFSSTSNKNCTASRQLDKRTLSKPSTADSVRTSRPRSNSAKVRYQAHRNAPFKTDPTIRVLSRAKVSLSKQAGCVLKHSKPSAPTGTLRSASAPAIGSEKSQDLKTQVVQRNCEAELQTQCKDSISVPEVLEQGRVVSTDSHDGFIHSTDGAIRELTSQMEAFTISKDADIKSQEKECDTSKTFCLVSDGSKLCVPGKLRRVYAINCRLRQNYQKLKVTRKVGSGDVALDLMEKIENEFDAPHDLLIRRQLVSCLQSHKNLLDLLHKLNLTAITELSSPDEVLHAKMMTEFILTSFDSLQQECSELMIVDVKRYLQKETSEIFHNTETVPLYWLPSNASCGHQTPPCPTSLSYQTSKDASHFHHAIFQLQLLQLQTRLIESVKTQFLPLLHSLDPSSHEFIPTFRGIYALLTSEGQHQPGFVGDSLDDLIPSACS
ncbi:uncharacterized protein LOC121379240 [Gigantopelta aegis]|uniref:uncharacterized protein LOC121379240 n=1 Tax=Gigantopelta aegis TaxID=1735272 RepID=UPI001B88AD98|nr:uncharacterized protein LOC121379240 [Gigantopelta aegis]